MFNFYVELCQDFFSESLPCLQGRKGVIYDNFVLLFLLRNYTDSQDIIDSL